ncbi:MAG TPA: cobyric acid synthase [Symbiobacteriaceae bacterium]|nr:cobyric acid synthase [Symbiobacteriaceae bacterium]
MARCLMVQGTASGVGKSLLATALCRMLMQDGYRVAPFKAWNMSLNAFVTPDGAEIGRAQGTQAAAAGVPAESDFNPILVKPKGGMTSQVVLNGRTYGDFTGFAAPDLVGLAHETARKSLERLNDRYDWIVIEGAGSPAEPNLRDRDMANMAVADLADAPVILVADMDRGGAFAALLGTLELLEPRHRERVAGLVLNRYHGPKEILLPGIREIEARTGKPILGVLPYLADLYWDEEDSVGLTAGETEQRELTLAVVRLPHLANFTDATPLAAEPDVSIRYVDRPEQLADVDLVILPGSKNTVADLAWLKHTGLAGAIAAHSRAKGATVGLCGGYQMMGVRLDDPDGLEDAPGSYEGLGVLPVVTRFAPGKRTTLTAVEGLTLMVGAWSKGLQLQGYEIHSGVTELLPGARAAFRVVCRGGAPADDTDGCQEKGGWTFGTYLHGLFENDEFRRRFLNGLRARRGLQPLPPSTPAAVLRERTFNRLAQAVREHIDLKALLQAHQSL